MPAFLMINAGVIFELMQNPMKDSEAIAKGVIETLLPGAVMHYRLQQSSGEYDFDLVYRSGQIAPLEVTVTTDQGYKEMVAALRDTRKGGLFVNTKLCRRDWYVFPAVGANASTIRKQVDAYLADIEAEGRERFFVYTDAGESLAVARIFTDLRIEAGEVFRWKRPGQIGISLPSQKTVFDPEHFLRSVESEAHKLDNRKKVGSTNLLERHLLVYIEHDNFPAWHAINGTSSPLRSPLLPTEITHIWAVASSRESDKYIVWKASISECWSFAGNVTLTRDQIQILKEAG